MIPHYLWMPSGLIVLVVACYALLFRYLFAWRVQGGLALAAFAGSLAIVGLGCALFFFTKLPGVLVTGLLGGLQNGADLAGMLRLALIYAALPEEAVKIGVVALLLLVAGRQMRRPNDPAQLLVFSALGFALPESLLYLYGFAAMPEFRDSLMLFAVMRGTVGALLHVLLALIAGRFLLPLWTADARRGWRWLWLVPAYLAAVAAHAVFDGSLLHLIFQGLAARQAQQGGAFDPMAMIPSVLPGAAAALLLIIGGFLSLRRILRSDVAPTAPSPSWRIAGLLLLLLAVVLVAVPATLTATGMRGFGTFLVVLSLIILMKRRPFTAAPLPGPLSAVE
ncbi:MAG: PrsW family glutamic-type intramembrane protease [Dongiaceae bacterium]